MVVQSFPQLPQFWLSELRSKQFALQHPGSTPPQTVGQLPQWLGFEFKSAHPPEQQAGSEPMQMVPQEPQLFMSNARSVQFDEQHPGCARPLKHSKLQLPQLLMSEVRFTQLPLHKISGEEHEEPEPVPTS
jgi:hypothetical protein